MSVTNSSDEGTIYDLPEALVQQVLSLFPLADVCRFRTVCKKWNSLICMPGFSANLSPRYIIGRCFHKHFNGSQVSINVVGWRVFDLNEKRWYSNSLKGGLVTNDEPLASDGGFVLCCSMVAGTSVVSEITISNPIVSIREVLPPLPFRICARAYDPTIPAQVIVDNISHTYKIFLLNLSQDPVLFVDESTSNQWRSSSYPPVRRLNCGLGPQTHSVIFQGQLYVLCATVRENTSGYNFQAQDYPIKYWLFSYDFEKDVWKDTGVKFPNWSGKFRKELVVSANRLFVVSGRTLFPKARDGSITVLRDPPSITEISLSRRTLITTSHLAAHVFDAQGLEVDGGSFELNQAFGFGDPIILTYRWLGFSLVYHVVRCLWELLPSDRTVQFFGKAMPLIRGSL